MLLIWASEIVPLSLADSGGSLHQIWQISKKSSGNADFNSVSALDFCSVGSSADKPCSDEREPFALARS
jgi:hypothetical protein